MTLKKSKSNKLRDLTISLKNGDRSAFRVLFNSNHKKIYNVSRSFKISHEDAEGIVQEVFIILWEKRKYLNEYLSLDAFMMTITKRLVFKKIRSNLIRSKHENSSSISKITNTNQTEDYIIFKEMNEYAQQHLDRFSNSKKQIFMLSKQHGLSNDEIATKLGLSKRTVENQLYRAIKELKRHIKNQG